MARTIKLYMFTGSGPSMTARLMLDHKGIDYTRVELMVGAHVLSLLAGGFRGITVPALKVDGRRLQGSRRISRALDELAPERPLFPADPERRRAVEEAERWGEEFQDAVRRIILWAAHRDRRAFLSVYRHSNAAIRSAQGVSWRIVTQLATSRHGATDRAAGEDVAALSARLDRVDAWIEQGLLNGAELNAADFQIGPAIALLLCLEDLRPFVEGRPAARLGQRLAIDFRVHVGAVMPDAWLAPVPATATTARSNSASSSAPGS